MSYNADGVSEEKLCLYIGEGWHPLVRAFKAAIDWDQEYNQMPPVVITQVKEKFGELRIYYNGGDKRTDAYASFAMLLSKLVCEECGAPAETSSIGGWMRTVCERHA